MDDLSQKSSSRVFWRSAKFWSAAFVLSAAAGAGYYFYAPRQSEGERPAEAARTGKKGGDGAGRVTPVVAQPAKKSEVKVYLTSLGTVTPVRTVTVRSRVDGQIMRVLFREGQLVRQGDALVEIDPRPFQAQLTQVEGQMARDNALLTNARIDLERYRTLFAQDSISKQQVDTQDALVRQFRGTVQADQAAVGTARLNVDRCYIKAPLTGRVGLRCPRRARAAAVSAGG